MPDKQCSNCDAGELRNTKRCVVILLEYQVDDIQEFGVASFVDAKYVHPQPVHRRSFCLLAFSA
jgi:hypothetical protein